MTEAAPLLIVPASRVSRRWYNQGVGRREGDVTVSSQPVHEAVPVPGLYERLITTRLEQRIQELQEIGWHAAEQQVGDQSSPPRARSPYR